MTDLPDAARATEDGQDLLIAAFEQAQRSGKANWYEMTTAVLKNRLLLLTGGEFDERQYGVQGIAAFAEMFPDTVAVDRNRPYPLVVLRGHESSEPEPTAPRTASFRLRPDLWDAVFDFSKPEGYVWDAPRSQAVPRSTGADGPILPTLTPPELDAWREEFAIGHQEGLDESALDQLENWRVHRLPTRSLPQPLQLLWNQAMKEKAAARLRSWFAGQGIPAGADLLMERVVQTTQPTSTETETLRRLVQACVARMSSEELRALALPASAVVRVVTRARSSD